MLPLLVLLLLGLPFLQSDTITTAPATSLSPNLLVLPKEKQKSTVISDWRYGEACLGCYLDVHGEIELTMSFIYIFFIRYFSENYGNMLKEKEIGSLIQLFYKG